MFARDVRSAAEIDRIYVEGYDDRRHMDGQRVNAMVNVDVVRRFAPDLSGKSVLDIGSGYGFFLHALRGSGAQRLTGVELSEAQRRHSAGKLNIETLPRLDDLSNYDQFDIVTLFEVIEHIPEPPEFISIICRHLKPGGSLIIGTDNFASDVVNKLGDQFPKWIPHEHVSLFTPQTINSLLTASGVLEPLAACSYTPWELLLRQLIFEATGGRKGGKHYDYLAENDSHNNRGFRFFALRLIANKLWFSLAGKSNLDGEMMYVHATKLRSHP